MHLDIPTPVLWIKLMIQKVKDQITIELQQKLWISLQHFGMNIMRDICKVLQNMQVRFTTPAF